MPGAPGRAGGVEDLAAEAGRVELRAAGGEEAAGEPARGRAVPVDLAPGGADVGAEGGHGGVERGRRRRRRRSALQARRTRSRVRRARRGTRVSANLVIPSFRPRRATGYSRCVRWRGIDEGSDVSEELWRRGAGELAELIARREVSSREVVDAHLDRIEAVNGHLNAIVLVLADEARAAADAADADAASGPLHGVPVTVKENIDVAGTPTTSGVAGAGRGGGADRRAGRRAPARRGRDPDRPHQPPRPRPARSTPTPRCAASRATRGTRP